MRSLVSVRGALLLTLAAYVAAVIALAGDSCIAYFVAIACAALSLLCLVAAERLEARR